jgi:hypothetical protein
MILCEKLTYLIGSNPRTYLSCDEREEEEEERKDGKDGKNKVK